VSLEIFDEEHYLVHPTLVRRYSSTDKPEPLERIAAENPIPMYWVRPAQILSGEAGMHRFVWDLHLAPPEALVHEYPISAIPHDTPRSPLGARALPGRYTVKLTVDSKSYTQPLVVKMDPRIKTSPADLRKQFAMEESDVAGMNKSYKALEQVQSLREQLKDRASKAPRGALTEAIAALDKEAAELAGGAETSFFGLPASGKQPENLSTLNQHFGALLAVIDSADAVPTSQATAVHAELLDALDELTSRWKKIQQNDLASVNASLKKEGLPELDLNRPPEVRPSADAGDDDEP
jgi:hypothetical protein